MIDSLLPSSLFMNPIISILQEVGSSLQLFLLSKKRTGYHHRHRLINRATWLSCGTILPLLLLFLESLSTGGSSKFGCFLLILVGSLALLVSPSPSASLASSLLWLKDIKYRSIGRRCSWKQFHVVHFFFKYRQSEHIEYRIKQATLDQIQPKSSSYSGLGRTKARKREESR